MASLAKCTSSLENEKLFQVADAFPIFKLIFLENLKELLPLMLSD